MRLQPSRQPLRRAAPPRTRRRDAAVAARAPAKQPWGAAQPTPHQGWATKARPSRRGKRKSRAAKHKWQ
eukprot:11668998-Alexandrium_andersonii.AAC.1